MANETNAAAVTEIVNSEWIRPVINQAAKARAVTAQFALEISLIGKGTNQVALPQEISDVQDSTMRDAIDATEGADLANTSWETTEATLNTTEYGILRRVTDNADEDNILGAGGLFNAIVMSGGRDMAVVLEDDMASLLDAFATTVGATTVDLSIANLVQAFASLRDNNMPAEDGVALVLGSQQATDYDAAVAASTGTQLARYITKGEADNGLNGQLGTFMTAPVVTTSLSDTANAGADTTGALIIRGDNGRNPESAALAVAVSRNVRVEMDRSAKGRGTDVVITQRKGVSESVDLSGVSVITDA